jgi:hypothetical protein
MASANTIKDHQEAIRDAICARYELLELVYSMWTNYSVGDSVVLIAPFDGTTQ